MATIFTITYELTCFFLSSFLDLRPRLWVSISPTYRGRTTRKGSHIWWRVKKGVLLTTPTARRDLDTKWTTTIRATIISVFPYWKYPFDIPLILVFPQFGWHPYNRDGNARRKIRIQALKVSATLQDRPRADRCSVSCFYKNPYKPYIF